MLKIVFLVIVWGISVLMLQHFLNIPEKLSIFIFFAGAMILHRFRNKSIANLFPVALFISLLIYLSTIQASNDRNWHAEVSELVKVEINNNLANIENLRNFSWHSPDRMTVNWESRSYDLNKLTGLNLIVVPFKDSKYMAHTMLDFNFSDQGHVIVSVETRKEQGEEYGLVSGALRQFELTYVFGADKDLLGLRALVRNSNLHLYPVKAEPEFIVSLFKDLANSANQLHDEPKFYRTLRDNCTTTLVKHIDRQYQDKIGFRLETMFPAKAGELLANLGHMDSELSYPEAYNVSRIDHLVRQYWDDDDFSVKLHEGIKAAYKKK